MKYEIKIEKQAIKFISKQPKPHRERILKAIYQLPNEGDIKKLKGSDDTFRLRVGDYRVIYSVDGEALIVSVVDVGNRGQIYNKY